MPLNQFFDLLEQRKASRIVLPPALLSQLKQDMRAAAQWHSRVERFMLHQGWFYDQLRKLPESERVDERKPTPNLGSKEHLASRSTTALEGSPGEATYMEKQMTLLFELAVQQIEQHRDRALDSEKDWLDFEEFLDTWTSAAPTWFERHRLVWQGIIILLFFSLGPSYYCLHQVDIDAGGVCVGDGSSSGLTKAIYFAAVTLTTVGYGDVFPKAWTAQIFTCFYIFIGLGLVANAVLDTMADVLEWYADRLETQARKKREQNADLFNDGQSKNPSKSTGAGSPGGGKPKFGRFNTSVDLDRMEDDSSVKTSNLRRSATSSTSLHDLQITMNSSSTVAGVEGGAASPASSPNRGGSGAGVIQSAWEMEGEHSHELCLHLDIEREHSLRDILDFREGRHEMPGAKAIREEYVADKNAESIVKMVEKRLAKDESSVLAGADQDMGSPEQVQEGKGNPEKAFARRGSFVKELREQLRTMVHTAGATVTGQRRTPPRHGENDRFSEQLSRASRNSAALRPHTGLRVYLQTHSALYRKFENALLGESELDRKIATLTYTKIAESAALLFVPIFLGVCVVMSFEDFTFTEAVYWSTVTVTTVGYGDLPITDYKTRWFCIIFLIVGCGMVAAALTNLASLKVDCRAKIREFEFSRRKLTPELLAQMDTNGDGVDEFEFCLGTLVAMEKVTREDLDPIFEKFHELDHDGSGVLTREDLLLAGEQHYSQEEDSAGGAQHQGAGAGAGASSTSPGDAGGGNMARSGTKALHRKQTRKQAELEAAEQDQLSQESGEDRDEAVQFPAQRPNKIKKLARAQTKRGEMQLGGMINKSATSSGGVVSPGGSAAEGTSRATHDDTEIPLLASLPARKSSTHVFGVTQDSSCSAVSVDNEQRSSRSTPKPIPRPKRGSFT